MKKTLVGTHNTGTSKIAQKQNEQAGTHNTGTSNVNVILLNSLLEDNIGAHNIAAHDTGASKTGQHLLLLRRSQHNLGTNPPQVVLHSLPFNVDVILLNSLLLVLTAKPTKLMVEKVVLHGLLLVLRMLAANASS